jgi:hypothetical protein
MSQILRISILSLITAALAYAVAPSPAAASDPSTCMSSDELLAQQNLLGQQGGGTDCFRWLGCTYNCNGGGTGLCQDCPGGEIVCGPWGGICGEECVGLLCAAFE